MNADELNRRYAAGERDFMGVKLRNAFLTGASLNSVKFNGGIFPQHHYARWKHS